MKIRICFHRLKQSIWIIEVRTLNAKVWIGSLFLHVVVSCCELAWLNHTIAEFLTHLIFSQITAERLTKVVNTRFFIIEGRAVFASKHTMVGRTIMDRFIIFLILVHLLNNCRTFLNVLLVFLATKANTENSCKSESNYNTASCNLLK